MGDVHVSRHRLSFSLLTNNIIIEKEITAGRKGLLNNNIHRWKDSSVFRLFSKQCPTYVNPYLFRQIMSQRDIFTRK